LFIIATALLAAALAVAFLAGCGSDESKARQNIEQAKEKSVKVAQNEQKLSEKGLELSKFYDTIQNITPETAAVMKQFLNDAVALQQAINDAAQATRTEYEKILALNDVADFKKYAQIEIKILDLINQRSVLIKQFAAIYNGVVDYLVSGQPDTPEYEASIQAQAQPIKDERIRLSQEIDKLNEQAADLAKKLNI
jgi:septal ring factor EnvC (AmiA/AmiB activator)